MLQVMYVTATFPYVVTTIYLIRGVTLPGAAEGIAYMLTPNVRARTHSCAHISVCVQLSRLFDPMVWLDAASQIFYSMGLAFGGIIAFSSYNPPKNDVKRDVYILSACNLFTSLYTGCCIFSILGYKGHMSYTKCIDRCVCVCVPLSSSCSATFKSSCNKPPPFRHRRRRH
jgi:SNF family Na+-dependent transporter